MTEGNAKAVEWTEVETIEEVRPTTVEVTWRASLRVLRTRQLTGSYTKNEYRDPTPVDLARAVASLDEGQRREYEAALPKRGGYWQSDLDAERRAHGETKRERDEWKQRAERAEVQLAACGVAAMDGRPDMEVPHGEYGWSASYADVLKLRREVDNLRSRDSAGWRTDKPEREGRYEVTRTDGVVDIAFWGGKLQDWTFRHDGLDIVAFRELPAPYSTDRTERGGVGEEKSDG